MTSPSLFQRQYPLSRKKFWKKLLTGVFHALFIGLVFGVVGSAVITLVLSINDPQFDVGTFGLLSIVLMFAFGIISLAIKSIYVSAYIKRYYYDASEQFLTIQKGVFSAAEIHVPYQRIQDVYVDQDILDRLLGIYDVHIASATVTSGIEAHIDGVDTPVAEALKNFLLNKIQYGYAQAAPSTGTAAPAQPALPPNVPITNGPIAGRFNSNSYPIASAWLFIALFSSLWSAVISTLAIYVFLLGKRTTIYQMSFLQALIVFVVLFVAFAIRSILWRNSFFFEFSPQFILMKDGVIQREEKHVPYRTLQNVVLNQSFVERLFGLSTVVIENAAPAGGNNRGNSRITIPGQPFAQGTELVAELNRVLGGVSTQNPGL